MGEFLQGNWFNGFATDGKITVKGKQVIYPATQRDENGTLPYGWKSKKSPSGATVYVNLDHIQNLGLRKFNPESRQYEHVINETKWMNQPKKWATQSNHPMDKEMQSYDLEQTTFKCVRMNGWEWMPTQEKTPT